MISNMECIRRRYGVPARRGARVRVRCSVRCGTIIKSRGLQLAVRLDDGDELVFFHPNDLDFDSAYVGDQNVLER